MTLTITPLAPASTGLSQAPGARLSRNGRFQFLLIALLLITWSLTGAHNAIMAAPGPFSDLTTADASVHHANMDHLHAMPDDETGKINWTDTAKHHDLCADHCLTVMLPVTGPAATSGEAALSPEAEPAHWQPWRADLTPPPPKPDSFSSLA